MRVKTETSRNTSLINNSNIREKTPKSVKTISKPKINIKPEPTNNKIIIKKITETINYLKHKFKIMLNH